MSSYDTTLGYEVIDALTEYYNYYNTKSEENIEAFKEVLLYLYNTSTDNKLKIKILDWFEENHYCINCGEKLSSYEYRERHDELDGDYYEYFDAYLCPNCDYAKIKKNMYEEVF